MVGKVGKQAASESARSAFPTKYLLGAEVGAEKKRVPKKNMSITCAWCGRLISQSTNDLQAATPVSQASASNPKPIQDTLRVEPVVLLASLLD